MSEQELDELNTYVVQREITSWEEQIVEATSFEKAKAIAESSENIYNWDYKRDTQELTGNYWVMNDDTGEEKVF